MTLKRIFLSLVAATACLSAFAEQPKYEPTPEIVASQQEFQNMRFGIFIHWGIYSMPAQGEWALNSRKYKHEEYKNFARGFYPAKFNAEEWVKLFKESGARYITFTSRHHDGFSMFGTKYSDYNIVDGSPFKRDILGELANACHNNDMRLHVYYSHLDWGRDDYYPLGRTGRDTGRTKHGDWNNYLQFMNNQLTEILTNYGKVGAIWFDGIWDYDERPNGLDAETWKLTEQYELIHRLQPSCLIGNNHHGVPYQGENIQIFECDMPGENTYGLSGQAISHLPLETCQTMNNSWGYRISDEEYKSADDCIRYLVKTAGLDANLLLNVGPRPDGTIPDQAVERLKAMGQWLGTYGETIYGTRGGVIPPASWGATTQRDNVLYVHVLANGVNTLFIPYTGNKVSKAQLFVDKSNVKFRQTPEGIILTVDKKPETVDHVIQLTFKNKIAK